MNKREIKALHKRLLKQGFVFEVKGNKVFKRDFNSYLEDYNCYIYEEDGKLMINVHYGDELKGYFDTIVGIGESNELTLKYEKHGALFAFPFDGFYIPQRVNGRRIFISEEAANTFINSMEQFN